jgi:hypothetical protein
MKITAKYVGSFLLAAYFKPRALHSQWNRPNSILFLLQVKNSFEKNELSKEVLIQKLSEAGSNLDESIQILSYEPSGSNEFQCCTSARECQKQLATFIKSLQSS